MRLELRIRLGVRLGVRLLRLELRVPNPTKRA